MKNFAKRISALVLAVVVSAAVLCPAAFAAQLPSLPKDECVVDDAGVLSSSTVQTITELNAQLESSCSGAQIGVLTVEYTGNDSTEDYATQAFNAWGIGSSSNNNGVLILLVMESAQYADGDYYLTYGDGFRNTTLAKQASAIAQTMEDQFAAKNYDGAVTTCARNVANTIADIYGVSLSGGTGNGSTVQPGYQGGQSSGGSTLTDILTLVVSVVLLIVIIRSMAYVFASPCGWLWCFGGPRPPRGRRRGPHNPPPPPGGFYGGFGGMGGGSFGGGAGRGGFGGIAEDAVADADPVALDAPALQKRLALAGGKLLPRAMDPAGADAERMGGVHQIAEHKAAVLNSGAGLCVGQHDEDRRRAVERMAVRIAEHGGVHPLQLRDILRLLQDDDLRRLTAHGGRGIDTGLQNGVQLRVRDLLREIFAHAAARFQTIQNFVHNIALLFLLT